MKRNLLPLLALSLAASAVASASVDNALLGLVPAETVLLTGIDVSTAKNSEFGQYLLGRMNSDNGNFESFMQATGFDPRRDLQTVLFAGFGPHSTQGRSRFAVLARGTFDADRISTAAKAKGAVAQTYSGLTLWVQPSHDGPTAFTFIDTGVALMGDVPTVQGILDHRDSVSTLDPGLLERINNVAPQNDMWFATVLSGAFLGKHSDMVLGPNAASRSNALQSIQQSSGGIHFGDVVRLSFDATTRSPQDATSLTDVIRFLSSMAQTQRQKDPHAGILASALDGMNLQASGSDVHLDLSIAEKNLEQLAAAAPKPGR